MSLREQLLTKIQTEGRVSYGSLCQLTLEEGYKVESMGRRLRELAEDGLIHPHTARSKRNTEYIASYTAKPVEVPKKQAVKVININGTPTAVLV